MWRDFEFTSKAGAAARRSAQRGAGRPVTRLIVTPESSAALEPASSEEATPPVVVRRPAPEPPPSAANEEMRLVAQVERCQRQVQGIGALDDDALIEAMGRGRLDVCLQQMISILEDKLAAVRDPWPPLVRAWWRIYGPKEVKASDLRPIIVQHDLRLPRDAAALGRVLGERADAGTVVAEYEIVRAGQRQHSTLWYLREA